jgi:SAM-dependent methyltransferase
VGCRVDEEVGVQVSEKLSKLYGSYYDGSVTEKRGIAARQTVTHIQRLLRNPPYGRLIDVGAGDGAVLALLDQVAFAHELHAVDISSSGVDAIRARHLPRLRCAELFDGYRIPESEESYDLGLAIHVLEHVEHERAFLNEITSKCNLVYVEVPLELTINVDLSTSGRYGHINLYTPTSFRNLLLTSELEILEFEVFTNSLEYETHLGGRWRGPLKHALRNTLLTAAPFVAPFMMTYLAGAVVRRRPTKS